MNPATVRLSVRWLGGAVFAGVAVDLLFLDPAQTVTGNVVRLYRDAGPVPVASWVVLACGWAAGAWMLLRVTVDALLPLDAAPDRRRLAVAATLATLGGLILSAAIPMFFVGFGQYSVAEDRGYAPPAGSLGFVSNVVLWTGCVLLLAGAALVVVLLASIFHEILIFGCDTGP